MRAMCELTALQDASGDSRRQGNLLNSYLVLLPIMSGEDLGVRSQRTSCPPLGKQVQATKIRTRDKGGGEERGGLHLIQEDARKLCPRAPPCPAMQRARSSQESFRLKGRES